MQAPKVKVADKITALQQIVSPFGKVSKRDPYTLIGSSINFTIDLCFSDF